jgi:hypothetical protein
MFIFDKFADSFIDDIGIFSDTWEFHIEHLRAVFQSLREAKLVAKPSKCFVGYGAFNLSNAFCVASDHLTLFGTFFFVRSVKGTDMSENCGMNFLLKPIRPKNDRISISILKRGKARCQTK